MASNPGHVPSPASRNPLQQLSLEDLRARTSMKWRAYPADVLPLWVAEMVVPLAEPVAAAIDAAVRRGDTGYPAGTGYAEAFAEFAQARWRWDALAVERTAIVPDVMLGIVEMLKLVTRHGDAVVVNCPVYPPFYSFVEHMGRRIVEAPLSPNHRLDFNALGAAFQSATVNGRPAAYLLCNPHNPTGTVHTAAELAQVAALADQYRVRVLADEIHAPLVLPGATFTPYLSVEGSSTGLSMMSASKGWNLAGLRAALAIAGADAAADLARLPEEVSHGPSHLGVIAHTAALRDGGDWLDDLLDGLAGNRALLDVLLGAHLPQVRFRPPQATYLAWLDCRPLQLAESGAAGGAHDSEARPDVPAARGDVRSHHGPAGFFLDRARVALSAGPAFGTGGAGHVRLNFATSREVLTQAVARMAAAVEQRHTGSGQG